MIAPFVEKPWLARHLRDVVPADARWYLDGRSGRDAYLAGHLPGAVFVDLDDVLAGPSSAAEGRHPLPDPELFADGLARLGIGDRDTVIAYDDAGGVIAARLAWMLRCTGHEAAVLNGGIDAWDGPLETGPLETGPHALEAARFTSRPWPPELLASIDEVADAGDAVLLDARDGPRYRGESEPFDARPGHIPGARSLPVREHVGPDGRLLPVERVRAVGVRQDTEVISSCGSGVTACHNLLVLEHLGMRPGRLYAGSWSEWSADPERPTEVGADPAG
jgi:thiosulfate/3-mercaptopyruvate sulfurtransferase